METQSGRCVGGCRFTRHWLILLVLAAIVAVLGHLLVRSVRDASPSSTAESTEPDRLWTCSMHPQVLQKTPGRCPICGMELVPVVQRPHVAETASSVPGHAAVMIRGELQQRIGVQTGRVEKGPLNMSVQAVGIVQPDQTRIARVSIKTEGWVDRLFVNYVGQAVGKGDPLLSIYSPQFVSTQQELLTALRTERTASSLLKKGTGSEPTDVNAAQDGSGETPGPVLQRTARGDLASSRVLTLADAARRRLELWDVPDAEIDQIEKSQKVQKDLILRSPIAGTVLEQEVYDKQYVTPEQVLYVIADLSTVWVQAQVYEYEIPHVELGRPATVTIPSLPDQTFRGKVVFIQPTVEETTRTVRVRIELSNGEGVFKPGMFVHISIAHPMGEGLLVPTSAVLRTGERDIVYRVEPNDRFTPVTVKISPIQFGDSFQVLEGLDAGEPIVTSANFLIDSESRLQFSRGDASGLHHSGHDHD